ncbi:MAG TPA: hypothetical protein VM261_03045 [Kofleriaceae bacterium]|nr:hypothetical protein [Kofleriaceae bacterium]
MQAKNLPDILGKNGFKKDGETFLAPAGSSCSVYLGLGDDALVVDRVTSLELSGDVATVVTQRRERYAVEISEIRAVRVTPEASGPGYR